MQRATVQHRSTYQGVAPAARVQPHPPDLHERHLNNGLQPSTTWALRSGAAPDKRRRKAPGLFAWLVLSSLRRTACQVSSAGHTPGIHTASMHMTGSRQTTQPWHAKPTPTGPQSNDRYYTDMNTEADSKPHQQWNLSVMCGCPHGWPCQSPTSLGTRPCCCCCCVRVTFLPHPPQPAQPSARCCPGTS